MLPPLPEVATPTGHPATPTQSPFLHVSVSVRVRPPVRRNNTKSKTQNNHVKELDDDDGLDSVVDVNAAEAQLIVGYDKPFQYDLVLDQDTSQSSLYRQAVSPVVQTFLAGHHAAILAYGQTGAGKTYTMGTDCTGSKLQNEDRIGVIPRALNQIFDQLLHRSPDQDEVSLSVSFVEIHNEKIFDLLNPSKIKVPLRLKEEGHGFSITDLTTQPISSASDALALLSHGCQTRSTGSTLQNASSSRSHAIFRLTAAYTPKDYTLPCYERRLSLVDLAGSESLSASGADVKSRQEGININKGLSVLNRCIGAICHKDKYVPFRESSLTKVLRECLVDRSGRTAMIACVSPSEKDLAETVNTLRYANSVKQMEKPSVPAHMLALKAQASASVRKRRLVAPTPDRFRTGANLANGNGNHTIATPTPSKVRKVKVTPKMNSTALAGGFVTPAAATAFPYASSTIISKAPSLETIADDSASDWGSSIQAGDDALRLASSSSSSVAAPSAAAFPNAAVLDMMREVRDEVRTMHERFDGIKRELEQSMLAASATASAMKDRRRSPRLLERERMEENLNDDTIISGSEFNRARKAKEEHEREEHSHDDEHDGTIISGSQFNRVRERLQQEAESVALIGGTAAGVVGTLADATNRNGPGAGALVDATNRRRSRAQQRVEATASPVLMGRKEGGGGKTPKRLAMEGQENTPHHRLSIRELEQSLGLNPDSPLLFDSPKVPKVGGPRSSSAAVPSGPKPRRLTRRSTMLRPELCASINKYRKSVSNEVPSGPHSSAVAVPSGPRRSVRLSTASAAAPPGSMAPPVPVQAGGKHPLQERSHWKVHSQEAHNANLLTLLNSANMSMLQKLPGIGPKTAIVLHSQRELRSGFSSLADLEAIPGLQKNFFRKFCTLNQISM